MATPGVCKHDPRLVIKPLGSVNDATASHGIDSAELDQAATSLALRHADGGLPALPATHLEAAPMLDGNQLSPRKEPTFEAAPATLGTARARSSWNIPDWIINFLAMSNGQAFPPVGNVAGPAFIKFTALPRKAFKKGWSLMYPS